MIICNQVFEEQADLELAKQIGEILFEVYPGWLWAVEIRDHSPIIRLLNAPVNGYCWFINRNELLTPTTLRKHVVMGAGEFLERCGARRGRNTDLENRLTHCDGAEQRFYTIPKSMRT